METRFTADNNVGKLARWMRMMGYDTALFKEKDDRQMIRTALAENRVVLSKDAKFMKRRLVTNGTLKAVLVKEDDPKLQVQEVIRALNLDCHFRPFSLCLECNAALLARDKRAVRDLVPPHVFRTQTRYWECPACHRIYWKGTHWRAMARKLADLEAGPDENDVGG